MGLGGPDRRGLGVAALLASLLLHAPAARPFASLESEDGAEALSAIGSVRLTAAYLHFPDVPQLYPERDDWLLNGVHRLLLDGRVAERLAFEVNFFTEVGRAPAAARGGSLASAGSWQSPYRTRALAWTFLDEDAWRGELGLDRLRLTLDLDPVAITVGRFPINHSVTQIFAPNDVFAPFSASAVNKIYKPGVDAVRVSVAVDEMSTVEVAAVLGWDYERDPTWGRSAVLARAGTVIGPFAVALIGGKVAERWLAGASLQGEIGPLSPRAEGHLGLADANGDGRLDDSPSAPPASLNGRPLHGRFAVGLDYFTTWQNAAVGLEYLYVSDGADAPAGYLGRASALFPDDTPYLGQHYLGLTGGGEILPILRVQLLALLNATDGSGLASLFVVWNATDEIDVMGGALLPWGQAPTVAAPGALPTLRSEYGAAPVTVLAETRIYY